MKPVIHLHEMLNSTGTRGRGYAAWKRAKIERGLAQSRDRTAMIPAEIVLRQL